MLEKNHFIKSCIKLGFGCTSIYLGIQGIMYLIFGTKINWLFMLGFMPIFVIGNADKYVKKVVEIKIKSGHEFKLNFIKILKDKKWKVIKEENNELIVIPPWTERMVGEKVIITVEEKSLKFVGAKIYVEKIIEIMDIDLNS